MVSPWFPLALVSWRRLAENPPFIRNADTGIAGSNELSSTDITVSKNSLSTATRSRFSSALR
ncbi:hypothetical protein BC827DRAFT_715055 [Russula dissimulans]|nr:hypothetical protein BC827DRAFT_715055 [Russula dissimulans]